MPEERLDLAIDATRMRTGAAEGASAVARLERSVERSARRLDQMQATMNRLGNTARLLRNVFITLGGALALRAIVRTAAEFEQLRARLFAVTRDAKLAAEAFQQITQFASSTPFQVQSITDAFTRLRAVGIAPSTELLRDFGDLAAAWGQDISEAAQAVVGAITGETDRLKAFGIVARIQGEEIRFIFKNTETTVDRTTDAIVGHLRKLASENFSGAMAAQMNTVRGSLSNLSDAFALFSDQVGTSGLNQGLGILARTMAGLVSRSDGLATSLGQTLGGAVSGLAFEIGELDRSFVRASSSTRNTSGEVAELGTSFAVAASVVRTLRDGVIFFTQGIDTALLALNRLQRLREGLRGSSPEGIAGAGSDREAIERLDRDFDELARRIANRSAELSSDVQDALGLPGAEAARVRRQAALEQFIRDLEDARRRARGPRSLPPADATAEREFLQPLDADAVERRFNRERVARENLEQLRDLYDEGKISAKAFERANIEAFSQLETAGAGAVRFFDSYTAQVRDAAAVTESVLGAAFGAVEDQIAELATTGRFNFKQFANSIIADMTRIAFRLIIELTLRKAINSFLGIETGTSAASTVSSAVSLASSATATTQLPEGQGGGVFSGPESGYPVILHGTETVQKGDVRKDRLPSGGGSEPGGGVQLVSAPVFNVQATDVDSFTRQFDAAMGKRVENLSAVMVNNIISRPELRNRLRASL